MEVAADYLVMAAWLAYLKSRLLLPDPGQQDEEITDMAGTLRYQLVRLEAMHQAQNVISLPANHALCTRGRRTVQHHQ